MISNKAAEVAARKYQDALYEGGYTSWDDLLPHAKVRQVALMRLALEAAAPHMIAEAWEVRARRHKSEPTDPYR